MTADERWLPSFTQLERLDTAFERQGSNDVAVRALDVRGTLDLGALQAAYQQLVGRHPALTATFARGGRSGSIMLPGTATPDFAVYRTDAVHEIVQALRTVPFDLATGPLVRLSVIERASEAFVLLLVADHIVMDARSLSLALRDLWLLYACTAPPQAATRPPDLTATYGDWTRWERDHLQGRRLARLIEYWTTALRDVGPLPDVGLVDRSARMVVRPPGLCQLAVGEGAAARLCDLGRQWGTTSAALISAVFKAAVHRYRAYIDRALTGPQVAVFGAFPNRLPPWADQLVGYLANSAVVCTDLGGDPPLDELARRESRALFGALLHQDLPHALVVRTLAPKLYGVRYWGNTASIPRYLNFDIPDPRPVRMPEVPGLRFVRRPLPVIDHPRSGLRVQVHVDQPRPVFDFRYDPSVYTDRWVRRLAGGLAALISQWTAAPSLPLSAVDPFVGPARRSGSLQTAGEID